MNVRLRSRWSLVFASALALALVPLSGHDSAHAGLQPPPILASYDVTFAIAPGAAVTQGCQSGPGAPVCIVHPGQPFTVQVFLNDISGLPDSNTNGDHGYRVITLSMHYSAGLTFQDQANECAPLPDLNYESPDEQQYLPGENRTYLTACFANSEWTYEGLVAEVDLVCPSHKTTEAVTLTYIDTFLVADNNAQAYNLQAPENLVINCDNIFPWDIDDSGQVSVTDIFQVVQHFGQVKPTP
ncbi:MAG: hypothetical protein WBD55_04520 [Dehalococcoidia bacterium]